MSLTYGYDMKEGDKILEAPLQMIKILAPLTLPGGAVVNYLPFCALLNYIIALSVNASQLCYFQCDIFLLGSHTSATNR
jgi:hypothetical protein